MMSLVETPHSSRNVASVSHSSAADNCLVKIQSKTMVKSHGNRCQVAMPSGKMAPMQNVR